MLFFLLSFLLHTCFNYFQVKTFFLKSVFYLINFNATGKMKLSSRASQVGRGRHLSPWHTFCHVACCLKYCLFVHHVVFLSILCSFRGGSHDCTQGVTRIMLHMSFRTCELIALIITLKKILSNNIDFSPQLNITPKSFNLVYIRGYVLKYCSALYYSSTILQY